MRIDARRSTRATGDPGPDRGDAKALVAVDGFCPPDRPCFVGELLVPAPWCGRGDCTCRDEFHGVASHGTAALGRVVRLRGVPRVLLEAELVAVMRYHEGFDRPHAQVAALLDEVATIEEGRLVRREEDVLLPFPAAARIVGPQTVEFGLEDPL